MGSHPVMQLRRNAVTQSVTSCPPETERLQGLIRKEALENVTLFDLVLTFLLSMTRLSLGKLRAHLSLILECT